MFQEVAKDIYVANDDYLFSKEECDLMIEIYNQHPIVLNRSEPKKSVVERLTIKTFYIYTDDDPIVDTLTKTKFNVIQNILNEEIKCGINDWGPIHLRKHFGDSKLHTDGLLPDTKKKKIGEQTYVTKKHIRKLSCIVCLQNDGDTIIFPKHNFSYVMKKGDVIVFPPYWTHPHQVISEPKTQRYTLQTWFFTSS
jgi:hypothetical protein